MRLYTDEQVTQFERDGWWSGRTWVDEFDRRARDNPDRISLVDPVNRESITDGPPRRLTWSEVAQEVHDLARALHRCGVRQGDVVGVQLPNSVELAMAYIATATIGAIASPFPIQYDAHELRQMGERAGMTAFLTVGRAGKRHPASTAAGLVAAVPSLRSVLAWGKELPVGVIDLGPALRDDHDDAEFGRHLAGLVRHPNDCVTLCWTSGTEGIPKGVPRAHGDWMTIALGTIETPRLTSQDVLLNPFPMVNAGGMAGMFLPWLMLGARLVQHQPFDMETFIGQIEHERVTYTCAPPSVLDALVGTQEALAGRDISSLRAVGSGSAPMAGWMIEAWERRHGVEVLNLFGSNEGLCLFGCPDTIPDPAQRGRLFPRPGDDSFAWRTRIGRESRSRLVDLVTGEDIDEPGRPGELRVSSPAIIAGYWGDAPSPFDELGYYRTGDIFEFTDDERHLLVYVDRAKDLISRGGYKISAAEIESLLSAHPKVAEIGVVGMPDERLGEKVCAFVAPVDPHDPPTLDDLLDLLREQQVTRFKWPERLEVIEQLPRNPVGKVLKRDLRDQLRAPSS
ncbi:class I adenylate-forming enzyme family protein [Rudaeicoccus suwonensis]|uniref:Acyl-CoA synthetase (AMP-forming)/AMP-acid ligase II n=1 Tax=Rudaeicoccus suwonensis TaxID=657409 RepID=A0A561DWY9_9MICO|nr:class I adenylate-forming enzyme family protein [Rudaeicoccus suwonensis]TWE07873.1 acyl-CoA synthetase (AMP-forming)/AMP-acid ligase II [Rudaeicoccus suwonensis]